jgi:hypothetical protein
LRRPSHRYCENGGNAGSFIRTEQDALSSSVHQQSAFMPIEPLFGCLKSAIDERFRMARSDAGGAAEALEFRLEEKPHIPENTRAEFLCIEPAGPVRVTWNGIASVWALSQGAARLGRRINDGKRNKISSLNVNADPEIQRGLDSLELARRFRSDDISKELAGVEHWPSWAPPILAEAAAGSDDAAGLKLFFGALDWMFRHEVAHAALKHSERAKSEGLSYRDAEVEADTQAAEWLKGSLAADTQRELGARPGDEELRLEWRAVSIGIGVIWIALFESGLATRSTEYPPVAERLQSCLEVLGLRQDSIAAEILSDIVHVWISPEEQWAPPEGFATGEDALNEACFRLHRFLNS